MSSVTGRLGLLCVTVGLFAANAAAQQTPTYEMRIVGLNDTTIDPYVDFINANPGDLVRVEVFAYEWSPNGEELRAWQIQVDEASLTSGIRGTVAPRQGQRPCLTNFDCFDLGRTCVAGTCGGSPSSYEAGVQVDKLRTDWVYSGRGDILAIDTSRSAVRVASALLSSPDSPSYGPTGDINQPSYVATLVFEVDDQACGDFGITLAPFSDSNMVSNTADQQLIEPMQVLGITVRTVALRNCSCTQLFAEDGVVVSDPPHCWVDARQPSQPDGSGLANINSMDIRFNCPNTADVASAANFTLLVDGAPVGGGVATVFGNTPSVGWVRVRLADPIDAGSWSCVEFNDTGQQTCVGSLPGDADQDLESNMPTDLVKLISCAQGISECELIACDMDRSGVCAPGDVLRGIDLYNGGDNFFPWDGATLGACP